MWAWSIPNFRNFASNINIAVSLPVLRPHLGPMFVPEVIPCGFGVSGGRSIRDGLTIRLPNVVSLGVVELVGEMMRVISALTLVEIVDFLRAQIAKKIMSLLVTCIGTRKLRIRIPSLRLASLTISFPNPSRSAAFTTFAPSGSKPSSCTPSASAKGRCPIGRLCWLCQVRIGECGGVWLRHSASPCPIS